MEIGVNNQRLDNPRPAPSIALQSPNKKISSLDFTSFL